MNQSNLRAFVFGATGSVGRELVKELIKSNRWTQVTVIVRKPLADWDSFTSEEKKKLDIQVRASLEELTDYSKWSLTGYSSVFCCLGAAVNEVKNDEYVKVNITWPAEAAKLAAHYKVPHYSLISTTSTSSKSCIPKVKARGIMEDNLEELHLAALSIIKPGLITGRGKGERIPEKIFAYVPFFPKITAQQVGLGQRLDAEFQHDNLYKNRHVILKNSQIHEIVNTGTCPKGL